MATSQNGYPVLFDNSTTGPLPRLRKWVIPGTGRHLYLRDGSTGFLLAHTALWYHEAIERLDNAVWDEWGWAVRPVRGQVNGYSNHASGTAEDLNATRHPLGVSISATYTPRQISLIRSRMTWLGKTVVWGGNWSRPDGMHFEIGAPISKCERRARVLLTIGRGKRILEANPGAKSVILS